MFLWWPLCFSGGEMQPAGHLKADCHSDETSFGEGINWCDCVETRHTNRRYQCVYIPPDCNRSVMDIIKSEDHCPVHH